MKALLLNLEGPMQAWGVHSRFSERDSQLEPTKSGLIGLLCAALGWQRGHDLSALAALKLGVRADREGRKLCDFHTAGGGQIDHLFLAKYVRKYYGVSKALDQKPNSDPTQRTEISRRYYLSDARFTAALAGEDETLLSRIAEALIRPVYPLFLGRKSFIPAAPLLCDQEKPIHEGESLRAILENVPWTPVPTYAQTRHWRWDYRMPEELRLVLETEPKKEGPAGEAILRRPDNPLDFRKGSRAFRDRFVYTTFTSKPIDRWRENNDQQQKEKAS